MTFVFTFFIIIRWRAIIECALVYIYIAKSIRLNVDLFFEDIKQLTWMRLSNA